MERGYILGQSRKLPAFLIGEAEKLSKSGSGLKDGA